jgi:hypothetical protein
VKEDEMSKREADLRLQDEVAEAERDASWWARFLR